MTCLFIKLTKEISLSQNNLGERIEKESMQIPYLKNAYQEFDGILKKYPNKHISIEYELLKQ